MVSGGLAVRSARIAAEVPIIKAARFGPTDLTREAVPDPMRTSFDSVTQSPRPSRHWWSLLRIASEKNSPRTKASAVLSGRVRRALSLARAILPASSSDENDNLCARELLAHQISRTTRQPHSPHGA